MKISAHCNITNPETCGYPYLESIRSFASFCDEVIIVDGGTTDGSLEKTKEIKNTRIVQGHKWEEDFDWRIMGENLQIGYENCQNQWAFHFDIDYIFHEHFVRILRDVLEKAHLPAIELKKVNFVLANENFVKDYYSVVVNKGQYPTIYYGIGKDFKGKESATYLRPITKDKTIIQMSNVRLHREEIPIDCYDFTFMTREQVVRQRIRFENSLGRFFGDKNKISEETAFRKFINMMKTRHKQCKPVKMENHSQFIRERVKSITPEMFGHSGWELL